MKSKTSKSKTSKSKTSKSPLRSIVMIRDVAKIFQALSLAIVWFTVVAAIGAMYIPDTWIVLGIPLLVGSTAFIYIMDLIINKDIKELEAKAFEAEDLEILSKDIKAADERKPARPYKPGHFTKSPDAVLAKIDRMALEGPLVTIKPYINMSEFTVEFGRIESRSKVSFLTYSYETYVGGVKLESLKNEDHKLIHHRIIEVLEDQKKRRLDKILGS